MDSAIPEVNQVIDPAKIQLQTLDVLTSLKSLLEKNTIKPSFKTPTSSKHTSDPMETLMMKRREVDLGYLNDITEMMKRRFEFVLNPLNTFFKGNIIGIGLKRLYRAATNTSEEEAMMKKKRKEEAKEKLAVLQEDERLAKKRLKSIGITGDYSKMWLRDEEGKRLSSRGMSQYQILNQLIKQYDKQLKEKESNKYEKKIEGMLTKKSSKFKPTSNPSRESLKHTEAGQAMLWKDNEDMKKDKKPGFLDNILGKLGLMGGGLTGLTGTLIKGIVKVAPFAAIAAGLFMMVMDGIKGSMLSKKWDVSKLAGSVGGFLGGNSSGFKGAFANMGKWALIGAGIGTLAIPIPIVGTLIGGLLGAAVGGILGYIGGKKIAKGFDFVTNMIKDFVVGLPGLAKIGAMAGVSFGPPGMIAGALLGLGIESILQLFIGKKNTRGLDNMINSFFAKIINFVGDFVAYLLDPTKGKGKEGKPISLQEYTEKRDIGRKEKADKAAKELETSFIKGQGKNYKLSETQKFQLQDIYSTSGLEIPLKYQNYLGGIATTPGWVHVAEREPEWIIPQSKVEKGFDNNYVSGVLNNLTSSKEQKTNEVVKAIKELTGIMKNKDFNNNIIQNTQSSDFNFDNLRVGMSYNKIGI